MGDPAQRRPVLRGLVAVLTVAVGLMFPAAARAETPSAPPTGVEQCGSTITPKPAEPREINLVLDDSGSMFASDSMQPLDRWSQAKYSLEVFAAMMDASDTLRVYRMSDFGGGVDAGAAVVLTGAEPASSRVAKIHELQLQGGGTPYAPVSRAYQDLVASSSPNKWLVIVSDGEFDDRGTAEVEGDLRSYIAQNSSESSSLRVAFLSLGAEAPAVANEPAQGLYAERAPASSDLLSRMTFFSNVIFERNALPQTVGSRISPDIDLSEVTVFAQGADVKIGDLTVNGVSITPTSTVDVSWANNKDARFGSKSVPAVPNQTLSGKLATYTNVPAGDGVFDISGAQTVDAYFKPHVGFGIQLQDADGRPTDEDKIVAGEYTLYYGFMDDKCSFIQSPLLGDVEYSARVIRDGEVVLDAFQSGDTIDLTRGATQLQVKASYLGGNTAESVIDLTVLKAASPTGIDVDQPVFQASRLGSYVAPEGAIRLTYGLGSRGQLTAFSPEEWAAVTPESVAVKTPKNVQFDVSIGSEPGEIYLVPRAPAGEKLDADTGEIPLEVTISHVYDEQLYEAGVDTTVTVQDDIPWWERFAHWFAMTGWWLLLILIAAIILIGYVVKPRFSKKVKRRPEIRGVPIAIGAQSEQSNGKFRVSGGRKYLPYLADTAVLSYVPTGVAGFTSMRLKAARGGKMQLLNWKQIASRKNVAINGTDVNDETKRAPVLGPATLITATVAQRIRYEVYPNT